MSRLKSFNDRSVDLRGPCSRSYVFGARKDILKLISQY